MDHWFTTIRLTSIFPDRVWYEQMLVSSFYFCIQIHHSVREQKWVHNGIDCTSKALPALGLLFLKYTNFHCVQENDMAGGRGTTLFSLQSIFESKEGMWLGFQISSPLISELVNCK